LQSRTKNNALSLATGRSMSCSGQTQNALRALNPLASRLTLL
jgi:hypothetical protein